MDTGDRNKGSTSEWPACLVSGACILYTVLAIVNCFESDTAVRCDITTCTDTLALQWRYCC